MKIDYVFLDPTKNMTILVETPVPVASQPLCAARLMELEPSAEQVGFLSAGDERCDLRLRMAGGEFCGNAAMSAGTLYCVRKGLTRCRVRVSGAAAPVTVEIAPLADGSFAGTVEMPRPLSVGTVTLPLAEGTAELPLVRFGGIAHLVTERHFDKPQAEEYVRRWCTILQEDALGLMELEPEAGRMTPLVYVPGADTLFWENSCASGTTAAGCCLAWQKGMEITAELRQPGGVLGVTAAPGKPPLLRGNVRISHRNSTTFGDVDRNP